MRGRARWMALVAAAAVAGAALVLLVIGFPGPSPAASASPAPTPSPSASASPAPAPAGDAQQRRQYRAYVAAVIQGGTAVAGGLIALEGCRTGRDTCVARLSEATDQVTRLQADLAANPAPTCLSDADQRLQDALTFQRAGLAAATVGVRSENRLRLVQGLLLTAAGVWRAGQAIADARQSNC